MIKVDKNPEFIIQEKMDGFCVLVSGIEVKRKWFRETRERGYFFLNSSGSLRFTFHSFMHPLLIEKSFPVKFEREEEAAQFVKKIKRLGMYD